MITQTQMELMKHTVKYDERNWFVAVRDSHNSNNFENLIEEGYAMKRTAPLWSGDIIYYLTEKGISAVNDDIKNKKVV